jgi:homoserine/homoserine lactone efflux protein
MTLATWLPFVAASIVFSLSPGSGAISTLGVSLAQGGRAALWNIVGLELGLGVHIVVVGAGLGMLVAASATAFGVLKWVGAAYLVWLGIQKWRETPAALGGVDAAPRAGAMVRRAVLINLTNPKSMVFLAAFFPQFLHYEQPLLPQYLLLGATIVAVDALVMTGYALAAARVRCILAQPRAMVRANRVLGALFMSAGAALASARAA